jgi:predicted metallopeptidase
MQEAKVPSFSFSTSRAAPIRRALVLCWNEPENPLPVRPVHAPARTEAHARAPTQLPSLPTGPLDQPFDFSGHIRRLSIDLVARTASLAHIDSSRLLFGVTQARSSRSHGLQARVTPLRFHGGRLTRCRRGITYQVQRYFLGEHEFLYLMTFCLPRFLDQAFDDKLITLFHELYHISPAFDGDLRRHNGRYALHSHSQRGYDRHMADLARAYLSAKPDPTLYSFLRLDFAQLQRRHGSVTGVMVPRPKVIPVGAP